ncbi:hypothetical protein DL98DRAFT_528318 [Cadophora sp. DSE1049]|nr:hypothetical protein DL98DRAFT_528318 [Cadophora sp. DSE1049]
MESSSPESSTPKSLVGNAGDFVCSSPDGRYEVRKAIMVNFPAAAIVNATNLSMTCNTAAIPAAKFQITKGGGPDMLQWLCKSFPNGLTVGEAAVSPSFDLPNCYHIIHTNVPNFRGRTRSTIPLLRQQLVDCYRRCLEEAYKVGAACIAFPCLGAGLVLGWRRRDVSRLGLNTVRLWFKHPIHGAKRRERIPGPIYFLSDPVGPYEHQVDSWLAAFDDLWPLEEDMALPSTEEQPPRTPTMTIRTRKRNHRQNSSRRGGARRGHITRIDIRHCFYDEEIESQEEQERGQEQQLNQDEFPAPNEADTEVVLPENVQPERAVQELKQRSPKRGRVGQRELRSLQEGSSEEHEPMGRSRDRKPPQRYGY